MQNFAPIQSRRELSHEEDSEIADASKKVIPKIFQNEGDPLTVQMSSPNKAAILSILLGAGIGAGAGALRKSNGKSTAQNVTTGAALGAAGGSVVGLLSALNRNATNKSVAERMRRLPEGATIRDQEADPVYQAKQQRLHDAMNIGMLAASRYR